MNLDLRLLDFAKLLLSFYLTALMPLPVTLRSKAWVCGQSVAGIAGLNPAGRMEVSFLVSVAGCQVEVSASG